MQPGCTIETLLHLSAPLSPTRWLCSIPPRAVAALESVSDSREWPSGSRLSAATPGSVSPESHQMTSVFPASSTVSPGPRKDIRPSSTNRTSRSCSLFFSQHKISSILLRTNKCAPRVDLWCHRRPPVSPQARQANQGRSLLPYGSGSRLLIARFQGTAPDGSSSHIRSEGNESHCGKRNEPFRSGLLVVSTSRPNSLRCSSEMVAFRYWISGCVFAHEHDEGHIRNTCNPGVTDQLRIE